MKSRITCVLTVALSTGCSAYIKEEHYFGSYASFDERSPATPINFFRLRVEGSARFSNARYLSGFYDERAVDLFFNELKAPPNQRLFDDAVKVPGQGSDVVKPLSPTPANGAYVLILSTNADSIANAIGSFAESQVVAQALTRWINKDQVAAKAQSDVEIKVYAARAATVTARLHKHIEEAGNARTAPVVRDAYLRSLLAVAQGLGYRGAPFGSFGEAGRWFELEAAK